MQNYIIRQADICEADKIMEFINNYWQQGHILAKDKELFIWQYQDNEKLNIIIAFDDKEDILAILGFVKYGMTLKDDIVLALWKSNSKENPFLGVELLQYLIKQGEGKISCNGINLRTTKDIYEFLGFRIDYLRHYYRLNRNMEYKIAKINNHKILKTESSYDIQLNEVYDFDDLILNFNFQDYKKSTLNPTKSMEYIKHRYFKHPYYNYRLFVIKNAGEIKNTILVMREISCNQSKILRVVDCIGDMNHLIGISKAVDDLLNDGEYEYIDFLQYGISEKTMNEAGFILNTEESQNIIPNYFEPYECSNVKVWFCTRYKEDFYFFKADGDQDRPNKY